MISKKKKSEFRLDVVPVLSIYNNNFIPNFWKGSAQFEQK